MQIWYKRDIQEYCAQCVLRLVIEYLDNFGTGRSTGALNAMSYLDGAFFFGK